jgi:hypothetical protein
MARFDQPIEPMTLATYASSALDDHSTWNAKADEMIAAAAAEP